MKWQFTILLAILAVIALGCEQKKEATKASGHEDQQVSSHYEHLKDLDWLEGNWVDVEDNVETRSKFRWKLDKSFLVQRFSVKEKEQNELKGEQIIGWDPASDKIRSWIYDSDGGFGEGSWSKQGKSWYVETLFTLPDGRKGSAVHIYTSIDSDTFTFSSEDRDVDGNMLPNIGPIKMVRK